MLRPSPSASTTQGNSELLDQYTRVSKNVSELFRTYWQMSRPSSSQGSIKVKQNLELNAQHLVSLSTQLKNLGFLAEAEKGLGKAIFILKGIESGIPEANARNNLAVLLQKQGRHTEAIREFREALIICENKGQSKKSEVTANILNGLGSALQNAGQFEEAIPYLQRALSIHKKLHAPLLKTVKSMLLLGISLSETLSYPKAESLLLEALNIIETNPSINEFLVPTLYQLGKISMLVGMTPSLLSAEKTNRPGARIARLKSALFYYERLLGLEKEQSGTPIENLFRTLVSLRTITMEMDLCQKAEKYAQEALVLIEKDAPNNQKLMLAAQIGMADAFSHAAKYAEARHYYEVALKKIPAEDETEEMLNLKHSIITGLAQVLDKMSLYEESEKYFRQLIASLEKCQPTQQPLPLLAESLSNFAGLLLRTDKYEEGLNYCKRALRISEELYGQESSHVSATYTNMGALLGRLKNYQASLEAHQKALHLYQRDFGENSIQVMMELEAIAYTYDEMKRDEEARDYYERALKMQEMFSGQEYSERKSCVLSNYALFLKRQGEYTLALQYYNRALETEKQVSPESMGITKILDGLGHLYFELGNLILAKKIFEESLRMKRKIYPPYATEIGETLSNIADLEKFFSPATQFSKYKEAIRNYQQTGQGHHYAACSMRLTLAEEYLSSKLYAKAIKLLQELVSINQEILNRELPSFLIDDLSSHVHLLRKLAQTLVLNNQPLEAAKLFEQQAAFFENHFSLIAIYCLEQAIYYYKKIAGSSEERARLLIKQAHLLDQSTNLMKPWQKLLLASAKANALMPTLETKGLLEKYKQKYQEFLAHLDPDLGRQFTAAVSAYHELMQLYFFCEKDELPDSLKNKAMDIMLALCSILDQSYVRLLVQRVGLPNKKELGNLYFPVAENLAALKEIWMKKGLLSQKKAGTSSQHFLDQDCPQSYQAIIEAQKFSANAQDFLSGWLTLLFSLNNHAKHVGLVSQRKAIDLHQQMGTLQRASRHIEVVVKDQKIHLPVFLMHVFAKIWHLLQTFSQEMLLPPSPTAPLLDLSGETARLLITEKACDPTEELLLRIMSFNAQPANSHLWPNFQKYYLDLVKLGYLYIRQEQWQKIGNLYETAGECFANTMNVIAIIFWRKAFSIYKNAALHPELFAIAKKLFSLYDAMGLRFKIIEIIEEFDQEQKHFGSQLSTYLKSLKTNEAPKDLVDKDILSQLQYAQSNFLKLQCAWINYRALSPRSTWKLLEIQNQLVNLLIRVRHILDQVFRRTLNITVLEPNEVQLKSMHGYNYPVCTTEKKLQKKLKANQALGNPAGFLNLPKAIYEAIKSAQPFSDKNPAEHWLSKLVALSNKAKHERQPPVVLPNSETEEKSTIEGISLQFSVEGCPRLIPLLDKAIIEIQKIVSNCFEAIAAQKKLLTLPQPLHQYDLPKRVSVELPSLIAWLNTLTYGNFFATRDSNYYVDAVMEVSNQREVYLARTIQSKLGFGNFFVTSTANPMTLFVLPKTNEENAETLQTALRAWK